MPAAHSLSFGGARLASYIMARCLTIPQSRVTDSAVESNAQGTGCSQSKYSPKGTYFGNTRHKKKTDQNFFKNFP
jgi:hypothetical protein